MLYCSLPRSRFKGSSFFNPLHKLMGRDERRAPLKTPVWEASYTDTLYLFLGSRGIGGGVRENNAYCFLLRMPNLLTFIHNGGIWKVTIQPRLKNGTHFSCCENLPKGYNVQMSLCLTLTWPTWKALEREGEGKWGRENARKGGGELSFPFSLTRPNPPFPFPFPSPFNACHAGYSHMRCYITQWSATRVCGQQQGYVRVHSQPIPQESSVKIAFRRFLL